ncbi:hypothetical protein MUK42_37263 [Musa troglodytarum]|uniref:Uncharacterized protein n=1 Tax=Musa troglodytarum TaxID=320322 RepID=A0A9E7GAB5_9LILI|nr:hypothetical protein MUK42_37263 [Musa troglodytarum]
MQKRKVASVHLSLTGTAFSFEAYISSNIPDTKHLSLSSTVNPEKSVSNHRVVCSPSEGHHTIISHEKCHNL